ncbi:MAG: tyrosine--tRNA ligase [Bacteroidia bacterium]|nr:MAG: tyrosine--tRNA ligase [Bacteroidia bacterium]
MKLFDELHWRGFVQNYTPDVKDLLEQGTQTVYIGFDPTSDSLHVGNLMQIMFLSLFQKYGHKPIALVGGATGMIGDPSGKSKERNLLDIDTLLYNQKCIQRQLEKFLDFSDNIPNSALILNNYDWFKDFKFLDFLRIVGKHISINYMIAKESVQKRLETGISFTEFSYQLLQAYDFLYLYQHYNCKIQMGGADQWGNITTGTELIRRMVNGQAEAITAPLLTKADGTKFGKSESGNIWLDPKKTSPYKFYQFWVNTTDDDVAKLLKIFTFLPKEEIEHILNKHQSEPHLRYAQKRLAEYVTTLVHSQQELQKAIEASQLLFGDSKKEDFLKFEWHELQEIFEGVPYSEVSVEYFQNPKEVVSVLAELQIYPSKSEARKALQAGAVKVNKNKITTDYHFSNDDWILNKFLLIQKGKKNYHLIIKS